MPMLIKDYVAQNCVKFGDFYLPHAALTKALANTVRPLILEYVDPNTGAIIGRKGSSTLVRKNNLRFCICTRHQLEIPRECDPDMDIVDSVRIGAINDGQLFNLPTDRLLFSSNNFDEEYHDLLAFHVVDSETVGRNNSFAVVDGFVDEGRIGSLLVGIPHEDEEMDYEEPHLRIKTLVSDCEFDSSFATKVSHFRRYKMLGEHRAFNGCSGGAIFSVFQKSDGFSAMLDGIVVRANGEFAHIVDVNYISKLIGEKLG